MPFTVHEVDTSQRREVNRFVKLPFRLYEGNRQWVPPMMAEARLQLDRRRHPFYQRNDAAFFLAVNGGRDVGRLAVIHPRADNQVTGEAQAYFYLFECEDHQAAAGALFDAAADWARARSLTRLRGPLGFVPADGYGLLAEGFQHRPAIGIPYNHDYYPRLVEGWGFALEERIFSGYVDGDELRANFPQRVLDIADKVRERYGFQIKEFKTRREVRRWVAPRLGDVYERAFTHVDRDRHMSVEQLDALARRLLMVSDPRLLKFVTKDDRIVGFLFCFLDVSEGIQRARGRLFPFGWFHIWRALRRTDWLNLNGMGMLPEYQGMAGPTLMYAELYRALAPVTRIKHAEAVQVKESNHKSLNELRKFGVDFYKTHHVYHKEIS